MVDLFVHHHFLPFSSHSSNLCSDGNLNLNTSFDVDDDLLDNLSRGVKTILSLVYFRLLFSPSFLNPLIISSCEGSEGNLLNQTLVDSQLEAIPGLGTFTTRGFTGGNLQGLGWKTDWSLDAEFLSLGTLDEFTADLLEGVNLLGGEGDSDLVGFLWEENVG